MSYYYDSLADDAEREVFSPSLSVHCRFEIIQARTRLAGDERSLLAKKLHQVEASGKCEGDLRPEVSCGGWSAALLVSGLQPLLAGVAAGAYCRYYGVFD